MAGKVAGKSPETGCWFGYEPHHSNLHMFWQQVLDLYDGIGQCMVHIVEHLLPQPNRPPHACTTWCTRG
ncbi:unnamed protein product [Victoria cruziana]